eukprot:403373773
MSLSLEPSSNQYGEKSDIENVQNSSKFEEEKFDCQFPGCKKCFTTKFSLKRHYYIHSRRKTFNCEYCDKVFALPQYLREHQYTHTNQQPFVCGVDGCTESFRQRGKLSLHRRTHSNFNKKDYRILNADLNKKNQLLQLDRENYGQHLEVLDQTEKISEKRQNNGTKCYNQTEINSIDLEKQARLLSGNWQPLKRKRFEGCLKFNQHDSQSKLPLDYKNAETIQVTSKDSLIKNNLEQTQYQSKKLQQREDLNLQSPSHIQLFLDQQSEKIQDKIFGGSTNGLTTVQNYNPSLRFQLQTLQTSQRGNSEVQVHENFEAASIIRNLLGIRSNIPIMEVHTNKVGLDSHSLNSTRNLLNFQRQNLLHAIKPIANKVQIVPQILVNPYIVQTVPQNQNVTQSSQLQQLYNLSKQNQNFLIKQHDQISDKVPSNSLKEIYNYQGQLIQVTQRTIGEPQYVIQMNAHSSLNLQNTSQGSFPHKEYLIKESTMTNQIDRQGLGEASLALKDQTQSLDNQNHCNYHSHLICGIKLL